MMVARTMGNTMTNYRKPKKALTQLRDTSAKALDTNPSDTFSRVNYINAVFLLKELKDAKRSKKEAKTA